jgi:hypothetical protein
MKIPTLQEWWVEPAKGTEYRAPEIAVPAVKGRVYGSDTFNDGDLIRTSGVSGVDGRIIETERGTKYRLGRVSRKYRAWLKAEGLEYDSAQPFRVIP